MRSEVTVLLGPGQEFRFDLEGEVPMAHEIARRWLDDEFMRLECEPLRASGKVLTADKVLVVAQAAGPALLAQDWGRQFALAASAALARPVVRVDLPAMAISY